MRVGVQILALLPVKSVIFPLFYPLKAKQNKIPSVSFYKGKAQKTSRYDWLESISTNIQNMSNPYMNVDTLSR